MRNRLRRGEKRLTVQADPRITSALSQEGLTSCHSPLQTVGECRKTYPMLGMCRHTALVGVNCSLRLNCRVQTKKRIEDIIMNKRFMLTAAGAAATGIAGSASAVIVDMENGLDRWFGEHSWQVMSSGGSVVASMAAGSFGGLVSGTFSYVSNTSLTSYAGTAYGQYDLASGTYTVAMQDSWGDGWIWGSYQGYLAIGSGSGTVSSTSGSFSFTVGGVPAPGALALLGLAGVAGSRRRK
jgi:MYXO-CTERM domain-containing protein